MSLNCTNSSLAFVKVFVADKGQEFHQLSCVANEFRTPRHLSFLIFSLWKLDKQLLKVTNFDKIRLRGFKH